MEQHGLQEHDFMALVYQDLREVRWRRLGFHRVQGVPGSLGAPRGRVLTSAGIPWFYDTGLASGYLQDINCIHTKHNQSALDPAAQLNLSNVIYKNRTGRGIWPGRLPFMASPSARTRVISFRKAYPPIANCVPLI